MSAITRWFSTVVGATILTLGLAQTASAVVATGGNMTNVIDGYRLHVFTDSSTANNFVVTVPGQVEVLVVAGGAGGGGNGSVGGGGGAGGLIYDSGCAVSSGSIAVTVGAGGAAYVNGSNSRFGTNIAIGGGTGMNYPTPGQAGGSGGGGGFNVGPGSGILGQGNAGGNAVADPQYGTGGGGGAGRGGGNGSTTVGGLGGRGREFPQFAAVGGDASFPGWFAGGGGGSLRDTAAGGAGAGGKGGGGAGGGYSGLAGQPNTGGGGGGRDLLNNVGGLAGAGGSGIVIVRYDIARPLIENRSATAVTDSSAWMNGLIVSTGEAPITAVAVCWGTTDGGSPTSGLWQATNTLAGDSGTWTNGAALTSQATGFAANTTYYYRFYAVNASGVGWAGGLEYFGGRAAAWGGTITNYTLNGTNYQAHLFTNSGTFTVLSGARECEFLIVAGGGGGASGRWGGGGGGGAGGFIYSNSVFAKGSVTVTVGNGGVGGPAAVVYGGDGQNSVLGGLTAIGGGGGHIVIGNPGGSGGGSGFAAADTSGVGTENQGYRGGYGGLGEPYYAAGGGGGAGGVGVTGTSNGGNGGAGLVCGISGADHYYAGGGGGGVASSGIGGTGGSGIGGYGGVVDGGAGVVNSGSGGGGSGLGTDASVGGAGGSGIVIVRYVFSRPLVENRPATAVSDSSASMNGVIVSTGEAPITAVAVYWGATDGGDPASGLWQATNMLAGDSGTWTTGAALSSQATGLAANTPYYYRYYIVNALGAEWAASSEIFGSGYAAGGTVVKYKFNGTNYQAHIFTNSGSFMLLSKSRECEVLVVAGGGGGGANGAGGGGAGGLLYTNAYAVTAKQGIPITVGAGGTGSGASTIAGTAGGHSVFATMTALGGGGGASRDGGENAGTGGSGGGGSGTFGSGDRSPKGSGTAGQGHNGGNGSPLPDLGVDATGGGGGGAGSPGTDGAFQQAGNGGTGLQYASFAAVGGSPAGWFAGGGAGSTVVNGNNGVGGTNGGGGNVGTAGMENTGGGGGAMGCGGSGVVIVRFSLPASGTVMFIR